MYSLRRRRSEREGRDVRYICYLSDTMVSLDIFCRISMSDVNVLIPEPDPSHAPKEPLALLAYQDWLDCKS